VQSNAAKTRGAGNGATPNAAPEPIDAPRQAAEGVSRFRTRTVLDYRLDCGEVLPFATTAYRTLGRLNLAGDNAVLVTHGYTTGPSMLDEGANAAEGSWSGLIGPGRAIDTDRWFVVCPNMLGSSYGSTGPASIDPGTGKPYGGDFPVIALRDIVDLQKSLLESLGVSHLAAVAGPSFGGYQAYQWATHHPDFVGRVIAAVSAPFHPAGAGSSERVLAMLEADPGWRGGRYCDTPGAMLETLTRLRAETLRLYGADAELAPRIPDAEARADEIQRLARAWAAEFDAGSLLALMRAAERFDVRPLLDRIRAPLLVVNSRTDPVFSPALVREFGPLLDAARVRWSYVELDSDKGHLASGADYGLWNEALARFMA
jgi:homoserine O-acetyltransferase